MLQFSLVFMLQERGPRQKTRLMTDIITFGVGNSTILNQDGKTKILSHVACFYSKCLAKMKNERPASQCFLTIYLDKLRDWILFLTGESYSISTLSRYLCKIGLSVKKFGTLVFMNTVDLRLVLFRGMTLHLQMATKMTSCSR